MDDELTVSDFLHYCATLQSPYYTLVSVSVLGQYEAAVVPPGLLATFWLIFLKQWHYPRRGSGALRRPVYCLRMRRMPKAVALARFL